MANKKGLFGILNDGAGAGVGIDKANPDTTLGSAINNTIAAPAFINSSGVLVFPQLNADGAIIVSSEESGVCYHNHGMVVGSTSFQAVATIVAVLEKEYYAFEWVAASMTECDWELVHIDDVGVTDTETILARFDTGPGQYTVCCMLHCLEFSTVGLTDVQNFVLRGKLLEATGSEISATLGLREKAS